MVWFVLLFVACCELCWLVLVGEVWVCYVDFCGFCLCFKRFVGVLGLRWLPGFAFLSLMVSVSF